MSYTSLLINTADIIRKSVGPWGAETKTVVAAAQPCRIEYGNVLVRSFSGEQVVSHATVFFPAGVDVREGDWVRYGGVDHSILDIRQEQDSIGQHHIEVYIA